MRKEVAERWKVSVMVVVVGREIFEQQTGRKGSGCRMGKERRAYSGQKGAEKKKKRRADQRETRAALWRACR